MNKNTLFSICFVLLTGMSLSAQELGLHFMENIWQSNMTNPALLPSNKVTHALPGVYANFAHSSVSYNDLVSTNSEGLNVINSRHLLSQLDDQNYLKFQTSIETFHNSFGIKKMRFSLHHAFKVQGMFRYPKSLVQLAFEGNAPFIGQQLDIAPGFDFLAYNELGLGFGVEISKLSIGGRIKALTGLASAYSEKGSATLSTDDDIYQLSLATDYRINTAGGFTINTTGEEFSPDFDISNYNIGDMLRINRGWAIDLGAQLKINDKLSVAASIVDLGFIRWTENVRNFESKGNFTFEGLNLDNFVQGDSLAFSSGVDTIFDTFNFQETRNAYTTTLATKVYLSGTYRFTKLFRAGALIYMEKYKGAVFPAFALNGTVDLGKILSVGAVYSIHNKSYANIGLNFIAKLGPVQLFAASDNVLAMTRPASSRGTNARVGLNMTFK